MEQTREKSLNSKGPQSTHFVAAKSGRRLSGIVVVVLLLLTLYDVGFLMAVIPLGGVGLLIRQFPLLESLFTDEGQTSTPLDCRKRAKPAPKDPAPSIPTLSNLLRDSAHRRSFA